MKVLASIQNQDKILTNSPLDNILDGGIEKRSITQIYGPPGSGKTNIALFLSIMVAKSGKKVAYMDTEGGISIERIQQITGDDFDDVAKNIVVFEPNTFEEQEDDLNVAESWITANKGLVDLLVFDSAVALYRVLDVKSSQVTSILGKQMGHLSRLARKYDIAIVVTNQIYPSFGEENDNSVSPVGGTVLQYWSKTIIELERNYESGNRIAVLKRSKTLKEGLSVEFSITDNGIE